MSLVYRMTWTTDQAVPLHYSSLQFTTVLDARSKYSNRLCSIAIVPYYDSSSKLITTYVSTRSRPKRLFHNRTETEPKHDFINRNRTEPNRNRNLSSARINGYIPRRTPSQQFLRVLKFPSS